MQESHVAASSCTLSCDMTTPLMSGEIISITDTCSVQTTVFFNHPIRKPFSRNEWPEEIRQVMLPNLGVQRLPVRSSLALLGRRANTSAARSRSSAFHCVICFGYTSKRSANCASVWSDFRAAKAIFALNAAEWLRGRRLIFFPLGQLRRLLEQNFSYTPVRF